MSPRIHNDDEMHAEQKKMEEDRNQNEFINKIIIVLFVIIAIAGIVFTYINFVSFK